MRRSVMNPDIPRGTATYKTNRGMKPRYDRPKRARSSTKLAQRKRLKRRMTAPRPVRASPVKGIPVKKYQRKALVNDFTAVAVEAARRAIVGQQCCPDDARGAVRDRAPAGAAILVA